MRGIVFVVAVGIAKISLELQEFAVMSDGSFDPIIKFLVSIHWLHLHHGLLETNWESSEVIFT